MRRRVTQEASSLFFSNSLISFQNQTRGAGTRVGGLFLNRQFFFFFFLIYNVGERDPKHKAREPNSRMSKGPSMRIRILSISFEMERPPVVEIESTIIHAQKLDTSFKMCQSHLTGVQFT